ncbi:MAG: flagellar motor switch protein FliN [Leptonema sp. (in: bacteria)]
MVDTNMSQEEIDALLSGVESLEKPEAFQEKSQISNKEISISPLERERLSDEVLKGLLRGSSGLKALLNLDLNIENPYAELRSTNEIYKDFKGKNVIFGIKVNGSLNGEFYIILPNIEIQKIVSIIMGGMGQDANDEPLDAAQMSAIKDALNPLFYSLISYLSVLIGNTITPIGIYAKNSEDFTDSLQENFYLRIQYSFIITGFVNTKLIVILPFGLTKTLLNLIQSKEVTKKTEQKEEEKESSIPIKEVEFPSISTTSRGLATPNMELLLDVQMNVSVELGRTKKYIKEILEMGEGSIIELDKQAGENVDVLVNGKLIARGEVVVIDENFGVRITEIISPKDKLGIKKK